LWRGDVDQKTLEVTGCHTWPSRSMTNISSARILWW
jgi:hypothetical protein